MWEIGVFIVNFPELKFGLGSPSTTVWIEDDAERLCKLSLFSRDGGLYYSGAF